VNGVESAKQKVVRAGEHLQSLDDKAATYLSDHQSNFVIEESNGEQQLRFVKDPPIEIAILAGEIVYQLRSALNHLAFELVKSNPVPSLPKGREDRCEFPLFCSRPTVGDPPRTKTGDELFKLFDKKHLPGLTKQAFVAVEALQPYNGGDGPTQLGWLAKLSNIDKHRHFHVLHRQAYQSETVRSPRINSHMLARLQDGARIEPYLHSAEELADAVYVERSISDMFISFEESALPPNVADIALGEVLEHCMYAIDRRVIPVFEKLISNP
jgi:hypothetical protein